MKGVFNITPKLQRFYHVRGMWITSSRQPRGALASMLGPQAWLGTAWATGEREVGFYVTDEQIDALIADLYKIGSRGMDTVQQFAQTLRRLKEARSNANGSPVAPARPAKGVSLAAAASIPFEPLVCPPAGKARKAFEHRVMSCLHEVIDFSQESVYDTGE